MISVTRLRALSPITAAITEDWILASMEARALALLETLTRRYFGPPQVVTEYLNGRGGRLLQLAEPIAADSDQGLEQVEERAYPGAPAAAVDLADVAVRRGDHTDYLVRSDAEWARGLEYAVTYRRGYEIDQGPSDIEQLVVDLIGLRLSLQGKEALRSEQTGDYSWTRFGEGDLDSIDGARDVLASWRRTVFA